MSNLRSTTWCSSAALLFASAACSQADEGAAAAPGADSPTTVIEANIGPLVLDAGEEKTHCIVFRLKNAEGGFIRRFQADLGEGSHHMTLYESVDQSERLDPFDCLGFDSVLFGDRPIFIAQQRFTELAFPNDESGRPIGYEIAPEQMVRLEMHYINTTGAKASFGGKILLDTVPLSTSVVDADIEFVSTVDIDIPPNARGETEVKFVPSIPGTRAFALTTHQHHLASRMQVWHADDAADTASQPVADCTDWSNPPIERFAPPLAFGVGGKKGFAYQCAWQNPTPRRIHFGDSVNDEMCVLWAYYYPGHGFLRIVQN